MAFKFVIRLILSWLYITCIGSSCEDYNFVFYLQTGANIVEDQSSRKVTFTCEGNFFLFLTSDETSNNPDYKRAPTNSQEYDFPYCTSRDKNGFPQCKFPGFTSSGMMHYNYRIRSQHGELQIIITSSPGPASHFLPRAQAQG